MPKHFFALVCLFLFATSSAQANVVVRTSDQLEIVEGDIVDGELVAVGLPVVLSNNVAQDATLIGNRVTINGDVGSDLLAAGFFVDVNAVVADDVRVLGGEVSLSSDIGGDLIVLGGTVDILSSATVAGDVIVYGGAVTIAGSVGGDVVGTMETLEVNAPIAGGIDVTVTNFLIGDQASVAESVRYTSYSLVSQSLNSTVVGDVVRSDPPPLQDSNWMQMTIITLLVGLFSSLVWHLCSRKSLIAVVDQSADHILRSALVGFVAPTVLSVSIVVLILSQLGIYVGLVLFFASATLILLAGVAAPALVGRLSLKVIQYPQLNGPIPIVVGVCILTLCTFIPIAGVFLIAAAWIVALGGLLEALLHANK